MKKKAKEVDETFQGKASKRIVELEAQVDKLSNEYTSLLDLMKYIKSKMIIYQADLDEGRTFLSNYIDEQIKCVYDYLNNTIAASRLLSSIQLIKDNIEKDKVRVAARGIRKKAKEVHKTKSPKRKPKGAQ